MEENKEILSELEKADSAAERAESSMALGDIGAEGDAAALSDAKKAVDIDEPLDAKARTLSPTVLLLKRFFRSKLSITGLVIIIVLFVFSYLGPFVFNQWGEKQPDISGNDTIETNPVEVVTPNGTIQVTEVVVMHGADNKYDAPSLRHWFGTDESGYDIFARCMYGGRISLLISLIVVILETIIGVILGGLAGYFGKWVDQLIMRIVDIFQCIPTLPILLILGSMLNSETSVIPPSQRIFYLMGFLTLLGWAGTARIVRGQILSLREQEFMVAAEAMGLSTPRKIFKHLIPNVMPQLIVSMTLGLGGTILYESSLSYLGLGVQQPAASWGLMINAVTSPTVIENYWWVWIPAGVLIILAVLGFNFIGDGLRDALDPRMKR